MAFKLDDKEVAFSEHEFMRLCSDVDPNWQTSAMGELHRMLCGGKMSHNRFFGGIRDAFLGERKIAYKDMESFIRKMPLVDRVKYKNAIKYMIFTYRSDKIFVTNEEPAINQSGFGLDFVSAMNQAFYRINNSNYPDFWYGLGSVKATCDRYRHPGNINANQLIDEAINNGSTFDSQATRESVEQSFMQAISSRNNQGRLGAFVQGLPLKYQPQHVFDANDRKLSKNVNDTNAHEHRHLGLAIRRACKGIIEMVALNEGYRKVGAKVHFMLDGMGDLGRAAYKQAVDSLKGDTIYSRTTNPEFNREFVSITTSELCYCARNWDKIKDSVVFYIKGHKVPAPWMADFRNYDATNEEVYSNQEAWLRYLCCRNLIGVE